MTFKDLFSHPGILQAIEESGYTVPTQIQQEAIPEILKGSDVQACAQTGTGKTAAFILPSLLRMTTESTLSGKGPRVLILVPTRELAMQVAAEASKYTKKIPMIKTVCIFGGAPFPKQNKDLARPFDILVATPGRLIDHMERGRVDFSRLEMLILDEADRMLDMGFIDDVDHIAATTPDNRQTLMFSATLKPSVLKLSKRLLKNPVEIRITPPHEEHKNIEQRIQFVDNIDHKNRLLEDLLIDESLKQVIIFTATKRHADQLTDELQEMGHKTASLHGDLKQSHRTRTIGLMRSGKIRILVATDVAARGIDVPTVTHVINFDMPNNAEDYVHRIGRTGRAGATGIAISFVSPKDRPMLREIERFSQKKLFPEGELSSVKRREGKDHRRGRDQRGSSPKFSNDSRSPRRDREKKVPYQSVEEFSDQRESRISQRSFGGNFAKKPYEKKDRSFQEKGSREGSFYNKIPKERGFRDHASRQGRGPNRPFREGGEGRGEGRRTPLYGKKIYERDFDRSAPPFEGGLRPSKEGFGKRKARDTTFEHREKRSFHEKKRSADFQGSNIHRERAKALAGHRGQNAPFARKRRAPVHGQDIVQSKDVSFLPTEP